MRKITSDHQLNHLIKDLELKQKVEYNDLKSHFNFTIESLKPKNILKENIYNFTENAKSTVNSPDFKSKILKYGLGLLIGFATKKVIVGTSGGFLKRILGGSLQTLITGLLFSKKN